MANNFSTQVPGTAFLILKLNFMFVCLWCDRPQWARASSFTWFL